MEVIRVGESPESAAENRRTDVLFASENLKVRKVELGRGGAIPPCRMHDDVVFIVLTGRVIFTEGSRNAVVEAPDAVFIPGGAIERAMKAETPSVVLAIQRVSPETESVA